jgi:hypothetical protein
MKQFTPIIPDMETGRPLYLKSTEQSGAGETTTEIFYPPFFQDTEAQRVLSEGSWRTNKETFIARCDGILVMRCDARSD